MKRITIIVSDDVDARVRLEARRRGSSISAVVRAALHRHLPHTSAGHLSFFWVGEGGPADVSERVDEYVVQALRR